MKRSHRPLTLTIGVVSAAVAPVSGTATVRAGETSAVSTLAPAERPAVEFDTRSVASAAQAWPDGFRIRDFPLDGNVDLEVKPFAVVRPGTVFVVGRHGGPDRLLETFDPSAVTLLRGRVVGAENGASWVYLAIWGDLVCGHAVVGGERFRFASDGGSGGGPLRIVSGVGLAPGADVPVCGVEGGASPVPAVARGTTPPTPGLRHLELAADSDYEFFARFGDLNTAALYVVALYGAVSDIYIRDVNTRIELTFLRLWDTPNDLFNESDPFGPFATHWETNMGHVQRDVAQLLTGRRNLPYGGVAWLNGLCSSQAYSVAGYLNGFFGDPAGPSIDHWDLTVTSHELGHSCGTVHTHDYGFDACSPHPGVEQRGTIMSYCHTQNGGLANLDPRFHTGVQGVMESYIDSVMCVVADCNANNVIDVLDIQSGTSSDANGTGVPDECEDCNGNGVLDDTEIAQGAPDQNFNGVPDECEPDCNANGRPDDRDIAIGASADTNANGVPDECEPDCDTDGTADFAEIRANMSLDVDRDNRLDACADCDVDGTTDAEALAGAHNPWIASATLNAVREYHAVTGVRMRWSSGSAVAQAQDLITGPNGHLFVAGGGNDRVVEFDPQTGAAVGDFVSAGDGGLSFPAGLAFGPDGHLYVASRDTHAVLRYDGATGSFLDTFIPSGLGGLSLPHGLAFGPAGNLYVCSGGDDRVLEYDGQSGAFLGAFVSAGSGGLISPRGITFRPDGHMVVAGHGSHSVLEYDGWSGAFRGVSTGIYTVTSPWGVRIGPSGNLFVSGQRGSEFRVTEFDIRDGGYLRAYVRGPYSGLDSPTGFDFAPGADRDCNRNQVPDACDIAAGTSADTDGNGFPDECEVDCDANGTWDHLEILPRGPHIDCNLNGVPDVCDVAAGPAADCNSNGIPDACEPDCNANGAPDDCDVASGVSQDCTASGLPDECDIAAGTALDCDTNGVPDPCDLTAGTAPDCNANGTPDACDVAALTSGDCNTNAVPDECDLAAGTSADCNTNAIPDECDAERCNAMWGGFEAAPFAINSGVHGIDSIGDGRAWDNPAGTAFIFPIGCQSGDADDCALKVMADAALPDPTDGYLASEDLRPAGGTADCNAERYTLSGRLQLDFGVDSRWDWVYSIHDSRNAATVVQIVFASTLSQSAGALAGRIVVTDPSSPGALLDTGIPVTASTCYDLAVVLDNPRAAVEVFIDGTLRVTLPSLDPGAVRMDHFRLYPVEHGTWSPAAARFSLDAFALCVWGCVAVPPAVNDCNGNGTLDECDISSGFSADCDANGVPDECEAWSHGDFDGDGDVDQTDHQTLTGCLSGPLGGGLGPGCVVADLDCDGDVDLTDFATFQSEYTGPAG